MGIKFRLSPGLFREMQKSLTRSIAVEQGCFLLCSESKANGDHIIIANELLPLESSDFAIQKYDQLSVSPTAMLRISRIAQAKNVGLSFVHTHPMSSMQVDFSPADNYGNVHSFTFFNRMLPAQSNTALVFSGDMKAVSGRLYHTAHNWERINSVNVAGHPSLLITMGSNTIREVS
ncbi:MAG: hypothetical protein JAY84_02535 [Candidatus Thiodiazotropha taylori]|nr:hypothetical protein [Candidatus Thiodiazotropha taylori]